MARGEYERDVANVSAQSGLANSEVAFYLLDSCMMLGITAGLLIVWPPLCI